MLATYNHKHPELKVNMSRNKCTHVCSLVWLTRNRMYVAPLRKIRNIKKIIMLPQRLHEFFRFIHATWIQLIDKEIVCRVAWKQQKIRRSFAFLFPYVSNNFPISNKLREWLYTDWVHRGFGFTDSIRKQNISTKKFNLLHDALYLCLK